MIAPAIAVLSARRMDLLNASTNTSSVNSRGHVVQGRLPARRS